MVEALRAVDNKYVVRIVDTFVDKMLGGWEMIERGWDHVVAKGEQTYDIVGTLWLTI